MEKEKIDYIIEELLSIHNKIQESIDLERNGKIYYADAKLQGGKQKIFKLYQFCESLKRNADN